MTELDGTVALVTGASSGIGAATARELARRGAAVARKGTGVYNLTKHGVGAFSEALRQEVTARHVRVSLIEPGAVATELPDHVRDEVREQTMGQLMRIERLRAEDVADAIAYVVTRPRHVAVNEILIRPTEQEG